MDSTIGAIDDHDGCAPLYEDLSVKSKDELITIEKKLSSLKKKIDVKFSQRYPERIKSINDIHTDIINCITVSSNGTYLATGSQDNTRLILDAKSMKILNKYEGDGIFYSLLFSTDNKTLIGACGKNILFWEMGKFCLVKSLSSHTDDVICLSYNENGLLLSGSNDNTIRLWDKERDSPCRVYDDGLGFVNYVKFIPNQRSFISHSHDKTIRIWSFDQEKASSTFFKCTNDILGLALNKNGENIAIGEGCCLLLYKIKDIKVLLTMEIHKNKITALVFCRNDELIISSSIDTTIKIINIAKQIEEFVLTGHYYPIYSLWVSPEFDKIISSSSDKIMNIWNLKYREPKTLMEKKHIILVVSFSPNGRFIVCAGDKSNIYVYSLEEKRELENFFTDSKENGHCKSIVCLKFSKDGEFLVSCSCDNSVIIWNMNDRKMECKHNEHKNQSRCACFDSTEACVLSGGLDMKVNAWNINTRVLEKSYDVGDGIFTIDFNNSKELFAVGTDKDEVLIYKYKAWVCLARLCGHKKSISSIKFFNDYGFLATGSFDTMIKIWNIDEAYEEYTLSGHKEDVQSIDISNDDKFIASASEDFSIKIWNTVERREEHNLLGHTNKVQSVAFNSDSSSLVSVSSDGTLRLWKLSEKYFDRTKSEVYQNPPDFFNVISSLESDRHDRLLSFQSLNIVISKYKFTALHFLAFLGDLKTIEHLAKSEMLVMRSDYFKHTPIYYSIKKKHHKVTKYLLDQLCKIASGSDKCIYEQSLYAIRMDFTSIIESSSVLLDRFLSKCIYINKETFLFGVPNKSLPYAFINKKTSFNDITCFAHKGSEEVPLVLKRFFFKIPSAIGSKSSLGFIKALNKCKNDEIFRTDFIKYFALTRWKSLALLIYFNASMLWLNLVLIAIIINNFSLQFAIFLWLINAILILWEVIQISEIRYAYFMELWNIIDILRGLLTMLMPIHIYYRINLQYFVWVTVLLNILRGVTGFRAANNTRYYVKLIFESLKSISSFLLIFIYSTLSFGLLRVSLLGQFSVTFENLWAVSFNLAVGEPDSMNLKDFDMLYFTFFFAIIFNLILMLNMIISLLGDTFDEFQMMADIFNYKEMIDTILEMEYIVSIFRPKDEYSYLHICQSEGHMIKNEWKGKILNFEMHLMKTEKNLVSTIRKIDDKIEIMELKINSILEKVSK